MFRKFLRAWIRTRFYPQNVVDHASAETKECHGHSTFEKMSCERKFMPFQYRQKIARWLLRQKFT